MVVETKLGTVRRAQCSSCGGDRNCEVMGHHLQSGGDDNYSWYTDWYILTCRGCDNVFAQTVSTNSEDYGQSYNQIGEVETEHFETLGYWPALSKRPTPEWMSVIGIESEVENLSALNVSMKELYGALDGGLSVLAAIGVRTSFDIAAEILGIEENQTFDEKLKALVDKGHIRDSEREHLTALVDAGSASAHRGWKPTAEDLSTLVDTLESFIYDAFVLPGKKERAAAKIAKMKARVPLRVKAAKKKTSPKHESTFEK